jgi:hypothetical protein
MRCYDLAPVWYGANSQYFKNETHIKRFMNTCFELSIAVSATHRVCSARRQICTDVKSGHSY